MLGAMRHLSAMAKKKRVSKRQPPSVDKADVRELVDKILRGLGDSSDWSDEMIEQVVGEAARIREYGKWSPAYHRELVRQVKIDIGWRRFREKNR